MEKLDFLIEYLIKERNEKIELNNLSKEEKKDYFALYAILENQDQYLMNIYKSKMNTYRRSYKAKK